MHFHVLVAPEYSLLWADSQRDRDSRCTEQNDSGVSCVLNRVLFPEVPECHELFVPLNAVSHSEKSQIEAKLPTFVESFRQLEIETAPLRERIAKPPASGVRTEDDATLEPLGEAPAAFHPIVCCTSSRQVEGTEMSQAGYIQGAGDDTENWAHGLTSGLFWDHKDQLLSTSEPSSQNSLFLSLHVLVTVPLPRKALSFYLLHRRRPAPLPAAPLDLGACYVTLEAEPTPSEAWIKSKTRMEIGIGKSKAGSRMLREALPQITQFVSGYLETTREGAQRAEDIRGLPDRGRSVGGSGARS